MGESAVMGRPRVSVCIANYNGSGMITGCIESVLSQECAFGIEILVHDDASTDDSAESVERDYPSVRLIRSPDNVGFCVANNRMVAVARGEYVLLLNNDAELFPDALHQLMVLSESLERQAILGLPQYDYSSGEVIDRGCLLDPFFNPVPNLDPERRDVAMVIGACLWIPKSLWEELGGFPEWFGSIAEDLYLCCRARLAGRQVLVSGESGYRHRVGQSFGGGKAQAGQMVTTYRRRSLSERNKTYVMVTCSPDWLLPIMLPLHFMVLLIEGGVLSLCQRRLRPLVDIYLPVVVACWREWKGLWRVHQEILVARQSGWRTFFSNFCLLPYKLGMLVRHGLPTLG